VADRGDGNSAGLELVGVGEFAATTTNKMTAKTPITPGTQFCKCSQSRRRPHRFIMYSDHFIETAAATTSIIVRTIHRCAGKLKV
jgi:hypothetical protein